MYKYRTRTERQYWGPSGVSKAVIIKNLDRCIATTYFWDENAESWFMTNQFNNEEEAITDALLAAGLNPEEELARYRRNP